MKKCFVLFLVLAVLLMIPACGKGSGPAIAVVAQQSDDLFFLAAKDGALQAGKDLGIDVQWQTPDTVDAALQKEIMNLSACSCQKELPWMNIPRKIFPS